ncbi:MAG: hypothetical protein JSR66_03225 [Proteobacteria bacterium]|nr:hypothetical protein [Pseudomonadota bacterium]
MLDYLSAIEPLEPANWWADPPGRPSHTAGLCLIAEALAASLRSHPSLKGGTAALRPPQNVRDMVDAFSEALPIDSGLHSLWDKLIDAIWLEWPGGIKAPPHPDDDPAEAIQAAIDAVDALEPPAGSNAEKEYVDAAEHLKEALYHVNFVVENPEDGREAL